MKRFYCLILCFILCLGFNSTAFASDSSIHTNREIFEDGSYIETTITENSSPNIFATNSTKNGKKTSTYKNSDGKTLWSITVNGAFSYNGTSSKCTSSSITTTCPDTNWKLSNKSANKSDATAIATATAKRYVGSTCVQTITRSVRLTCSKTGTLS